MTDDPKYIDPLVVKFFNPGLFLIIFVFSKRHNFKYYKLIKALIMCLGLEPGAARWKAQTNSIVRSKCFILNIMILLAQRIRLCLSSFTSCCLRSNPVWPDLAKFHHFDQYLKIFAIFLRFLWFWPKFSAHFDTICMHLGKFLLLKMAKYWEHNLVTLVESQAHYIPFFRDL